MKKNTLLILGIILLFSCNRNKKETVTDYFEALNNQDTTLLKKCLDENFKTKVGDSVLNLDQFISWLKLRFKDNDHKTILELKEQDSLITVKFNYSTLLDSILGVKIKPEVLVKFHLKNNKIFRREGETDKESFKQFQEEFWRKKYAVAYYLQDKGFVDSTLTKDNLDEFIIKNIKKFYSEDNETQNKYLNTSLLRGTFRSETGLYREIEFKGASTVVVLGFFATSYVVDENYIRIKTDKSDLLLKIKDSNTLEGEGYAEGTYKKIK